MLRRGTPNISYYLIDDICGFLVNKWTKPLLGDLNLAKMVFSLPRYLCAIVIVVKSWRPSRRPLPRVTVPVRKGPAVFYRPETEIFSLYTSSNYMSHWPQNYCLKSARGLLLSVISVYGPVLPTFALQFSTKCCVLTIFCIFIMIILLIH